MRADARLICASLVTVKRRERNGWPNRLCRLFAGQWVVLGAGIGIVRRGSPAFVSCLAYAQSNNNPQFTDLSTFLNRKYMLQPRRI